MLRKRSVDGRARGIRYNGKCTYLYRGVFRMSSLDMDVDDVPYGLQKSKRALSVEREVKRSRNRRLPLSFTST